MSDLIKENMEVSARALSSRQELLVMAYHDQQASLLDRWRTERLLAKSELARDFLQSLKSSSEDFQSVVAQNSPTLKQSLWNTISQRIDQEERAMLYLGNRVQTRPAFWRRVEGPLTWGMAGGAVAAGVTLFMLGNFPLGSQSFQSNPQLISAQNSEIPQMLQAGIPVVAGASRQASVDVDWVRSDGAVRFFSDPEKRSTMIWVKKRSPVVRYYSPPNNPLAASIDQELTRQSSPSFVEQPRVIEKRVPQSFAVGNGE